MKDFLWPGEVGRGAGVSGATVRRLADAGLLQGIRDAKGRRRFTPGAVGELRRLLGLPENGASTLTKAGARPSRDQRKIR
jgi:DNA-binding transcriptional MerR regulator